MPKDLLAQPPGTELPADPGATALADGQDPTEVAARVPTSSAAWAALADHAFAAGNVVESYAYARVGYHRGLDADAKPFDLVFHGGSGSTAEEIAAAVDFGVVKMNVDTDMQYAFTRAIADHFFKNYDGVLKVDGEVGRKKAYDPRTYLASAETALAERVKRAVDELRATNTTMMAVAV